MDRCDCGARIVFVDTIDMDDSKEIIIYTCGVCAKEIEVKRS